MGKVFISIYLILFIQCDTNEFHNLNINPQAVNQIDLNFLFSAAELGIASNGSSGNNMAVDGSTNIEFCAHAIQHLATVDPNNFGDKYVDVRGRTNSPLFEYTYSDQLKNIAEILKQTGEGGYDAGNKKNMRNAARILRVFSMARLVDVYGNVPYMDANKGTDGIYFPKYDDGKSIYKDLFIELEEAAAGLSISDPDQGFKKADLIFKGDIIKWKKWAYSLMLRMAMRVSDADAAIAATYVSKAVTGGVMTSNADNVIVPMALSPDLWTNQNGISRMFYPGDGGVAQTSMLSKTLIGFLKGPNPSKTADDDPRLMILTGGIVNWTVIQHTVIDVNPLHQKGLPNGKEQQEIDQLEGKPTIVRFAYSSINFKMMQKDEPYLIMHYGEVELLLAEARLKNIGQIPGTPKEHYEAGVKAAMQLYTIYDPSLVIPDEVVTAYLITYPFDVYKPAIEMIADQLWVSKFMSWIEAWSDWRRLDFPKLIPTDYPTNNTGNTIPVRLKYPNSEESRNPNYKTGATQPDLYTTRVWWDVK